MEIKFRPEVKKSMSKFHCPVLSRSDLDDHKDCFCTQYKARSPETVPTNFWQLKSVHSLAIRVGETQAMVSRDYEPRQTKNNHHHHQRINPFHFLYTF